MDISLTVSVLALIVAIASTVVAVMAWHRSRTIYGIEKALFFRHPKGDTNNNEKVLKKLSSGKYTILSVHSFGGELEVILGRIKK